MDRILEQLNNPFVIGGIAVAIVLILLLLIMMIQRRRRSGGLRVVNKKGK